MKLLILQIREVNTDPASPRPLRDLEQTQGHRSTDVGTLVQGLLGRGLGGWEGSDCSVGEAREKHAFALGYGEERKHPRHFEERIEKDLETRVWYAEEDVSVTVLCKPWKLMLTFKRQNTKTHNNERLWAAQRTQGKAEKPRGPKYLGRKNCEFLQDPVTRRTPVHHFRYSSVLKVQILNFQEA